MFRATSRRVAPCAALASVLLTTSDIGLATLAQGLAFVYATHSAAHAVRSFDAPAAARGSADDEAMATDTAGFGQRRAASVLIWAKRHDVFFDAAGMGSALRRALSTHRLEQRGVAPRLRCRVFVCQ